MSTLSRINNQSPASVMPKTSTGILFSMLAIVIASLLGPPRTRAASWRKVTPVTGGASSGGIFGISKGVSVGVGVCVGVPVGDGVGVLVIVGVGVGGAVGVTVGVGVIVG